MFNPTNLAISKSPIRSWQRDRHLNQKASNDPIPFNRNSKREMTVSLVREKSRHLPFSNPPQPEELEAFLGLKTWDVVNEMRELGYSMTLNVPQSLMSLHTSFGTFNFYFQPETARINAVVFQS